MFSPATAGDFVLLSKFIYFWRGVPERKSDMVMEKTEWF